MHQNIYEILERFIAGSTLSVADIKELKRLFAEKGRKDEVSRWLTDNWDAALTDDIEISYEGLKQKIREYENQHKTESVFFRHAIRFSRYYQRVAAVLFIPLILGLSLYLFFSSSSGSENFYISEASPGQKAKLELPDGSRVWLNSGSSIKYSSEFDKKDRTVELKGEAFFDVHKNTGKPFLVHTRFLDVKVTGTRFNVNAYDDEPVVETALVEGKVNLLLKDQNKEFKLTPGNVLSYSKASCEIYSHVLNEEATISWKDNRLIFINDDFSKLVRKIEKWYNVEVVYNPEDFKNNKLTVKLLEGEQLSKLLEIIETAIGSKCTIRKNKIYITKN